MKMKNNYTINDEKKTVRADIAKLTDEEIELVQKYVKFGYKLITVKPNKSKTVAEVREELSKDENALAEFNRLYSSKVKGEGFHSAMKYYNDWKKN